MKILNKLTAEELAIEEAIAHGHNNPKNCEKHMHVLSDREIISFESNMRINQLVEDNVRVDSIDPKYNSQHLWPLLERYKKQYPTTNGLVNPILVEEMEGEEYRIISGHNRKWTFDRLMKQKSIPCFVVSKASSPLVALSTSIKVNQRSPHEPRRATIASVVKSLKEWRSLGGFGDIPVNKSKSKVDAWMDDHFPNQFLGKKERTRIFNSYKGSINRQHSIYETWDSSYEDSILANFHYPSRYSVTPKGKTKILSGLNYIDSNKKCFVLFVSSVGGHIHDTLFRTLMRYHSEPTFKKRLGGFKFHFIVKIDKPSNVETELLIEQENYLNIIKNYNNVMKSSGMIVEKVIFPARLKNQNKSHKSYSWEKNPTTKKMDFM